MNLIKTKKLIIILLCILTYSLKGQHLDGNTETEIYDFVKKEAKYLHSLKFKKYYKNFNDLENFVSFYEGDTINRNKQIKVNKKEIAKKSNYSKFELAIMTPFEDFFKDFDLFILTKTDIEQDDKKSPITKIIGNDITKNWNPKIDFTQNRYLICLLPKINSTTTVPKYGEFMILQIIEKKRNKWKVYSSWN